MAFVSMKKIAKERVIIILDEYSVFIFPRPVSDPFGFRL
jgi:hypothetical protein